MLAKELVEEPGTSYNYNSGGTHLLSVILTQASGKSTLIYAQEKLFSPLGIKKVNWEKLEDGHYDGAGFSLELLPKDLIKIGSIFLQAQQNKDTNIASARWITKINNDDLKKETKWGLRNSHHGYGWYSTVMDHQRILYSMGYGGQFILIVPDKELVMVTTHNHDTPDGIDQQVDFLRETFPDLIKQYGS